MRDNNIASYVCKVEEKDQKELLNLFVQWVFNEWMVLAIEIVCQEDLWEFYEEELSKTSIESNEIGNQKQSRV
jgi:hypothetical protein